MRQLTTTRHRTTSRRSAIGAKTLVKQASDEASELAESAAGHGWAGVAQAMSSAQETLDEAAGVIDGAMTATSEGISQLSEITEEMSSDEVARRLTEIGQRFETARTAASQALESLGDARTSAEQADAETLAQQQATTVARRVRPRTSSSTTERACRMPPGPTFPAPSSCGTPWIRMLGTTCKICINAPRSDAVSACHTGIQAAVGPARPPRRAHPCRLDRRLPRRRDGRVARRRTRVERPERQAPSRGSGSGSSARPCLSNPHTRLATEAEPGTPSAA
jgi:hypothetical protein